MEVYVLVGICTDDPLGEPEVRVFLTEDEAEEALKKADDDDSNLFAWWIIPAEIPNCKDERQ